jgi:acyl-CoA thioesterase-2
MSEPALRIVEGLPAVLDALDLETIDVDLYRDRHEIANGGRLYGGQVAAQALVAAERTVGAGMAVHSLHAYFLRAGDAAERAVFLVDRPQDGRTVTRRRVTAVQHGKAILGLEASFTTDRAATVRHHRPPEDTPDAPDCVTTPFTVSVGGVQPWKAVELRPAGGGGQGLAQDVWFRLRGQHRGDGVSQAALLTYLSDLTLAAAVKRTDPGITRLTSLDHVMWFHNEVRFDDWLLYAKDCAALGARRGLTRGSVFSRTGTLISTVAQEVLVGYS